MPFCSRIWRPSSSFVPERRTTSGSFMRRLSRAWTRPRATSSPRVMPPNTLIRTPLTFGFIRITARAFSTTSALAPPPMSQKLAALPPARCTRSSVPMQRPAPLPMIPMSRDDQGVDLGGHGVPLGNGTVQLADQGDQRPPVLAQAGVPDELVQLEVQRPSPRVRVEAGDRVRGFLRR